MTIERDSGPDYITDAEGRLAVALSVDVRNTDVADIVVQSAVGGALSDDRVAGRAVLAGGLVRVSLTRRVDCAEPTGPVPVGPLTVTARTPAGTLLARLPLRAEAGEQFAQLLREACGQVPVESALEFRAAALRFDPDAQARLPLSLRNLSASDIVVSEVRTTSGLSVEVLDAEGAPVQFPLLLPAPDFTVPRPPAAGERRLGVTAVFEFGECPAAGGAADRALLEVVVRGAATGAVATVTYGEGERALRQLSPTGCR